MTNLEPKGKTVEWNHKTVLDRVLSCKAMLAIHGFLSDGENAKVRKRIDKWVAANKK